MNSIFKEFLNTLIGKTIKFKNVGFPSHDFHIKIKNITVKKKLVDVDPECVIIINEIQNNDYMLTIGEFYKQEKFEIIDN